MPLHSVQSHRPVADLSFGADRAATGVRFKDGDHADPLTAQLFCLLVLEG